jgi:putative glutamine amidotransferase
MTALPPITLVEVMPAKPVSTLDAPLVGVVVPLNYPGLTDETRELVVRFTRTALSTLTDLGARLQIIDPTADTPSSIAAELDGLLLLGGGDVDPSLYGHVGDVPNLYGVDRRCDLRTLASIEHALAKQLPVFGICRGAQMINLAYGGTLIPDLGPDTPHHGHGDDPLFLDDTVLIEPDTRLADVLDRTTVTVRNGHHQAVGEVAPQLRVAARGVDGVIEAIEARDPDTWVLGVQWHPEDTDGPSSDRRDLFGAFLSHIDANRTAATGRGRR